MHDTGGVGGSYAGAPLNSTGLSAFVIGEKHQESLAHQGECTYRLADYSL